MVAVTQSLSSLGDVAALLRATPDEVERAAEQLRLTLPLRFRGVLYFDGDSIERIKHHLGSEQRGGG